MATSRSRRLAVLLGVLFLGFIAVVSAAEAQPAPVQTTTSWLEHQFTLTNVLVVVTLLLSAGRWIDKRESVAESLIHRVAAIEERVKTAVDAKHCEDQHVIVEHKITEDLRDTFVTGNEFRALMKRFDEFKQDMVTKSEFKAVVDGIKESREEMAERLTSIEEQLRQG